MFGTITLLTAGNLIHINIKTCQNKRFGVLRAVNGLLRYNG
jgi:hypothetical protein